MANFSTRCNGFKDGDDAFIVNIPDDVTTPTPSSRFVRFQDWSPNSDELYFRSDGVYAGKTRTKLILCLEKIQIGIALGFQRIKSVIKSVKFRLVDLDTRRKVFNPQSLYLHWWNKRFLISCMIAASIDALFFYIPVVDGKNTCLGFDKKLELITCVLRSLADLFYILHIFFQFRTGFLGPSSRIYENNAFIQDRDAIARRYLSSYFLIDILAVLPLPQVVHLIIIPKSRGLVDLKMKYLSRGVIMLQFFPRFIRVYPIYKAVRGTLVITEAAWVGVGFNFSLYMLASHIFGAIWYLNSIERQDMCWRDACRNTAGCQISSLYCRDYNKESNTFLRASCPVIEPNKTVFDFGVYLDSLQSGIVESKTFSDKFIYCFWWGLQNLGSLGQNLKTSVYSWEVVFVVSISIFGLFLFTLLIGNVQMYLQSNTIKQEKAMRAKMQDTERWMTHISLPDDLKDRIRLCVQYEWQKTRGFDDEMLLHNLPKDLRRNIKLHQRLALLHRVPIFAIMDERLLEEMCDRLKPVFIRKEVWSYEKDALAKSGGNSLSLGTTIYASRFAANLLRSNRRNDRHKSRLLERLTPSFLQKPIDPDFSFG
ncbi:hypothetical protein GIB67_042278 [Kingdonia uniflora]|uniref:Ion transport domain-containing protein n=1 Tax=Kingdonia uniflora TaxID=39325 RepID=A0A7J7LE11_9MAGN|nr:hypothetical protein GIB67_042278 [Kingdonia uniflora]